MYETRPAATVKHKIAELEASVKEEEAQRTEGIIAEEVDWLHDPGTPSKRATQYVRTKAESWRIKTLLAKALDSKDEGKQHSGKGNSLSEDQLAKIHEIHESLDRRISTVHDAVETVNKKLTLLIRLLRQTLSPDPLVQQNKMKEAQEFQSMQDMQARVDKHVLDVGLDTVSRIGGFPRTGGFP